MRCLHRTISVPHKWTFYFLMAVGFWNFVGAGVFGFLINMPIVSYFEVGTMLTPNHGHAAMMGVFGMLAMALTGFRSAPGLDRCAVANAGKIYPGIFLGIQHRPGAHGGEQSLPRRCASAFGCLEQRLLARPEPGVLERKDRALHRVGSVCRRISFLLLPGLFPLSSPCWWATCRCAIGRIYDRAVLKLCS